MKVVCIVQARMGSKRLPGKVLLPLGGHPVLWHVLTRCQRIPCVGAVVLAIPDEAASAELRDEARKVGVSRYFGPEQDVLRRYWGVASYCEVDVIVRITADCPFIDPEVCGRVLQLLLDANVDYASNVYPERTWPKGLDCQAFTREALERAHREATDPYDREHVCPWMERNLRTACIPGPGPDGVSLTLDTPEDYERLQQIMKEAG